MRCPWAASYALDSAKLLELKLELVSKSALLAAAVLQRTSYSQLQAAYKQHRFD